jgi:hypothetical protein
MRYDALNNFPILAVFSKRMSAFCASHKLSGGFIAASGLHLPNIDQIIGAFFAFHFYGLHGGDLLVFFTDYGHEGFGFRLDDCAGTSFCFFVGWFFGKATFCAAKHKCVAVAGFFGFKA